MNKKIKNLKENIFYWLAFSTPLGIILYWFSLLCWSCLLK